MTIWDGINGARVSYLWIDGLEALVVLIHLEVELGGGDGQGAFHHHGRSHELRTGAQVYRAWRTDMPGQKTSRGSLLKKATSGKGKHRKRNEGLALTW